MANGRICAVEGCGKPFHSGQWCANHYSRWKKHGDPLAGGTWHGMPLAHLESILDHADTDECLIWPYARNAYGRPVIRLQGKVKQVTRVILERTIGPPPIPRMDAAHSCGKGHLGCVNRHHLRWATKAENEADKELHGTRLRGESVHSAYLTEDLVREIRACPMSMNKTGEKFGITGKHVWLIKARKIWKHVI